MALAEKWIAGSGAGLTWTDAFASNDLNALVGPQSVLSTIQIDNSVALDMFADLSVRVGSTTSAGSFDNIVPLQFYLYPLNKDGTTYGDGRFTVAASGIPPVQYWIGSISITNGASEKWGVIRQIRLPPAKFKFLCQIPFNKYGIQGSNQNTVQYRTYNRSGV